VIPADRWHEPYMPREELHAQLAEGVRFPHLLHDATKPLFIGIWKARHLGDRLLRETRLHPGR
jgi:hypothetical protein